MFRHNLYHGQINILASASEILRLGEECFRLFLKRQSEASGSQGVYAYASESDTTNLQSSIFNFGLSGLVFTTQYEITHLSTGTRVWQTASAHHRCTSPRIRLHNNINSIPTSE